MLRHDPRLPCEREVIEVLVDDDLDREVERVPSADDGPLRAGRGLDAAPALARVLLTHHLLDVVLDVDHVDHLRLLELVDHLVQLAAATVADEVLLLGQLADQRSTRQGGLRRRRGAALLGGPASGVVTLRLVRVATAVPLLRRRERLLLLGQLVDQRQRLLQLVLAPLERFELRALARQRRDELPDLRVLRECDPPQLLDVLLSLELVLAHAFYRSHRAIHDKRFRDDDLRRQRSPADQLAAFDEQRQLARGQPRRVRVITP